MLIWALAVVGPPEHSQLLKYLLRLVQKGPQIRLVLGVMRYRFELLCCGRPSLRTIQDLERILSAPGESRAEWPARESADWTGHMAESIRICAAQAPFDLHIALSGATQTIPFLHEKLGLGNLDGLKNVYFDQNINYLFTAPTLFRCPMTLGSITIEVEGFSTLKETAVPDQVAYYGDSLVREKIVTQPHGDLRPIFSYGSSPVVVTPELSAVLRTPVSPESLLEICGFIARPLPHERGPLPTLIRPISNVDAFEAMVHGLATRKQAAIVRFQKSRGHVQMMCLSPLGYVEPPLYLLMEPLAFAQDWPSPPAQFPVLTKQPRHETFDTLIDALPALECNLANGGEPPSGSYDPATGPIIAPNPLADKIYGKAVQYFLENPQPLPPATEINAMLVLPWFWSGGRPRLEMMRHLCAHPPHTVDICSYVMYHVWGEQGEFKHHHRLGDPSLGWENGTPIAVVDVPQAIQRMVESYPDLPITLVILTDEPKAVFPICRLFKSSCSKTITFCVREVTPDHDYRTWPSTEI